MSNERLRPGRLERGASISSSAANLANTNMGVGMLALPSAMSAAGMLGGCVLLVVSAIIAAFGSSLLAECVDRVGRPANLSKIAERSFGHMGTLVTNFSVVVIGSSCAIGYLMVVGDMLPLIFAWMFHDSGASLPLLASRGFWILAALPVIAPLAFLRRLDSLRFASSLVVACVGIIVVTVIFFALEPLPAFNPCAGRRDASAFHSGDQGGV